MISATGIACRIGLNLRSRFVHGHGTAVEHRSVQRRNSALGFFRLGHLHESDAPRFARIPVRDDGDGFDGTVGCKQFPKLLLRHRDIQVSDKDVRHEFILFLIFPKFRNQGRTVEFQKGDPDTDRLSKGGCALREAVRFQLASPWGPWLRRIAPSDPPAGS